MVPVNKLEPESVPSRWLPHRAQVPRCFSSAALHRFPPGAPHRSVRQADHIFSSRASRQNEFGLEVGFSPEIQNDQGHAPVKALGIDYGQRFTGVAVTTGGLAPRPLKLLKTRDPWYETARDLMKIAVDEDVDEIVVGMPVTLTGDMKDRESDSKQGRRCRNLGWVLATMGKANGIRVYLYDEHGSSQAARRGLAESLILENSAKLAMDSWSVYGDMTRQRGKRKSSTKKKRKDADAAAWILRSYFQDQAGALLIAPN